jgi:DNA polymerase-4
VTRARTLEAPTQEMRVIRRTAGECLKSVDLDRRIRLLGVRASALEPAGAAPPPESLRLFD